MKFLELGDQRAAGIHTQLQKTWIIVLEQANELTFKTMNTPMHRELRSCRLTLSLHYRQWHCVG